MKTLYLCYFGLREPLVQTQVLPYLRELSRDGVQVHLLTFEQELKYESARDVIEVARASLAEQGVRWFSLPYHKRPPVFSTAYDIARGARLIASLARRERIDVLHARSHVPLAMALLARRKTRCRLVFDFRGLMAEEYADIGNWAENSAPYRAVKRVERVGIREADQLVVLTRRMRDWMVEHKLKSAEQIEVIPCCVDFARFEEAEAGGAGCGRSERSERFELIYAGTATGLYLTEEMGRFFAELRRRRPRAYFRILTVSPQAEVESLLRRAGLMQDDFWVGRVTPDEVPGYLRRAHLGISFRKRSFAQIAASPTKIPEYLAAGLPVVSSAGVGDTDELLEKEHVGVTVRAFDEGAYREAVEQALALVADPESQSRCESTARRYFDLVEVGGARYRDLYRRMGETERA